MIKKQTKYYAICYGIFVAIDVLILKRKLPFSLKERLISMAILFSLNNIVPIIKDTALFSIDEEKNRVIQGQLKATRDLIVLLSKLEEQNIKTTMEGLYEAEEYKRKYSLVKYSDGVKIMQRKYITLPTQNIIGKRKDISILQEHIIGNKEYVLILGSPIKKTELKPVFNI